MLEQIKNNFFFKSSNRILLFALCLCAFNLMTWWIGHDGVIKYLFRYTILLVSLILIYYAFIKRCGKVKISLMSLLWCPFFLYIIMRMNVSTVSDLGIIIIYFYAFVLISFVRVDIRVFYYPMHIIFALSMIYSFTVILQLIIPNVITPLSIIFSSHLTEDVILPQRTVNLSGIVGSVAYSAGYAANIIAFLLICKKFSLHMKFTYFCLAAQCAALILSGKRAHMLFCALAILYTLWQINMRKISVQKLFKLIGATILVTIVLVIGTLYFQDIGVFSRVYSTLLSLRQGGDITSGRTFLYQRAFELFWQAPLIGVGWGNYDGMWNGHLLSVHNTYLQILCETGIIGELLFIIPLWSTLLYTCKKLRKNIRENIDKWSKVYLSFSIYLQVFFILYSFTGSIIIYHGYILLYFFACTIAQSYIYESGVK